MDRGSLVLTHRQVCFQDHRRAHGPALPWTDVSIHSHTYVIIVENRELKINRVTCCDALAVELGKNFELSTSYFSLPTSAVGNFRRSSNFSNSGVPGASRSVEWVIGLIGPFALTISCGKFHNAAILSLMVVTSFRTAVSAVARAATIARLVLLVMQDFFFMCKSEEVLKQGKRSPKRPADGFATVIA